MPNRCLGDVGIVPNNRHGYTDYLSGCFWINLPISGTTFFLLLFFLDVHNPRTKVVEGIMAIDFLGSACILGLTLMLLLGLDFGGVIFPWSSPKVICLIIFGVVMGGLFIMSEKKLARFPLMPLGVFSHPSNIACLVVTFAHGFVSPHQQKPPQALLTSDRRSSLQPNTSSPSTSNPSNPPARSTRASTFCL